jgi:hypothetical protein
LGEVLASYPEFPFIFVVEDELSPSLQGCPGWTKQMILKIAVASLVKTDYYLTLDSDIFLTKPLSHGDNLPKLSVLDEKTGSHPTWWKSNCRVLQIDPEPLLKKKVVMGVNKLCLVDGYYAQDERQVYGNCVWSKEDITDLPKLVDKAFKDNALYHFPLVQSSIEGLDQGYLAELTGSHLA